jgi:hypothetical protein
VLFEQFGDGAVQLGDALVERLDVAGQLTNAASGDLVGQAVAVNRPGFLGGPIS